MRFLPAIQLDQYLCAVGDIVGDEKMFFAGKNNNQILIYLCNEEEVNKVYEHHPQIVINDKVMTVRKLKNKGHKIFLCAIRPGITDTQLINELSKYTRVVSDIKFVNLGARNERFCHLIGLRRTVLVDNAEDLPPFIYVNYENAVHKIFIVIDKVNFFKCQGEGHFIKNCPFNSSETPAQDRLDSTGTSGYQPRAHDENITSAFVPAFASRTKVSAPSPLLDPETKQPSSAAESLVESVVILVAPIHPSVPLPEVSVPTISSNNSAQANEDAANLNPAVVSVFVPSETFVDTLALAAKST